MPSLTLFEPLATVPHRLARALFRSHIEIGAFVSLGMGVVGLSFALIFGRTDAILAASGALCASIVDQPGPLPVKARMYALAVTGATALAFLTMAADGHPVMMGLLVAAMSMVSGLVSAYGKRAIGLGVSAVLALMFGLAANQMALLPMSGYLTFFLAGGISYALISLGVSVLLDGRNRRLFLGEAVFAFSAYMAAKPNMSARTAETPRPIARLP